MIGKLKSIHVSLPKKEPFLKEEVAPVPDYLDYNMWLGPAPFAPYTENRTEIWNWRMITDYSGGMITDWGAHLVDTAQVGAKMENSGPVEVSGLIMNLGNASASARTIQVVVGQLLCLLVSGDCLFRIVLP